MSSFVQTVQSVSMSLRARPSTGVLMLGLSLMALGATGCETEAYDSADDTAYLDEADERADAGADPSLDDNARYTISVKSNNDLCLEGSLCNGLDPANTCRTGVWSDWDSTLGPCSCLYAGFALRNSHDGACDDLTP